MDFDPSELPPLERTILQASALHYGRVGRSKLMETVRRLGARMPDGKATHHKAFKPVLENLLQQGWIEDTGNGLRCPSGFRPCGSKQRCLSHRSHR